MNTLLQTYPTHPVYVNLSFLRSPVLYTKLSDHEFCTATIMGNCLLAPKVPSSFLLSFHTSTSSRSVELNPKANSFPTKAAFYGTFSCQGLMKLAMFLFRQIIVVSCKNESQNASLCHSFLLSLCGSCKDINAISACTFCVA